MATAKDLAGLITTLTKENKLRWRAAEHGPDGAPTQWKLHCSATTRLTASLADDTLLLDSRAFNTQIPISGKHVKELFELLEENYNQTSEPIEDVLSFTYRELNDWASQNPHIN